MFTVTTFRDPWSAHIFHGRLLAEGVPAFVLNDNHVWVKWQIAVALGGVRVQVPEAFISQALDVLAQSEAGAYEDLLEEEFGDIDRIRCPVCGSRNIRRRCSPAAIAFGIALLVMFGVAANLTADRCTCRVSGTRWRLAD